MRILYLCPDLDGPSGGVEQIYHHVRLLHQVGLPASVVHFSEGFRWPFAPADVPATSLGCMRLSHDDHLVLPEGWLLPELLALPVEKHVFVQGLLPLYGGMNDTEFPSDIPRENILCCSKMLRSMLAEFLGLRPTRVPNAVDASLFRPGNKRRAVAYMPRKEKRFLYAVKGLFQAAFPGRRDVEWIPVENMTKEEAAEVMGSCFAYLSTSFFEGFGMPPLEAMACETIVVGTHGYGGREFANRENGFWCDQADIPQCARLLGKAFDLLEAEDPALERMRAAGRETVKDYTLDHQKVALLRYWQKRLG
ncbi:glycosyltransferase family 4 protein [Salidesulfovibrio onnuriiensis]|uniref:glycosyltransferase family 4 protein n=1 Tax=Salidesulfovibrio onnuriiensis TaxID=2583823 RepID=UPI0011C75D21|nr:glycosyltransferase family 4 protein [Salidesulfovibrio onnuriiensis]